MLERLKNMFSREKMYNIFGLPIGGTAQTGLADTQGDKYEMLSNYKSWVYACVNIKARAVAGASFRLYGRKSRTEMIEIEEHPMYELLDKVNPKDTKWSFLFSTVQSLELTGNAYWYKVKDGLKTPRELYNLRPDWIKIIPNEDGTIKAYRQQQMGRIIDFPPEEIVHIKYPNPLSYYYGASPLMAAAVSVDINTFQHQYQRKFYADYAVPQIALNLGDSIKSPKQDQIDLIRKNFEKTYGKGKTGVMGILYGGMKVENVGIKPSELDWLATNRATRDEVLSIFGVPASKLGLVEDVNRANAEANDYTFAVNTIEPLLTMLDEVLTQDLASDFDSRLIVCHDSAIPKDEERNVKISQMRISSGLSTINEERIAIGYDNVAGGDDVLVASNLIPLSKLGGNTNGKTN